MQSEQCSADPLEGAQEPFIVVIHEKTHELRKQVDAALKAIDLLRGHLVKDAGGKGMREVALAYTKLQEGKMWLGKVLEATNAPFPEELRDEAK